MVITSSTRNRVGGNTPRGFESHLLRQNNSHPFGWLLFFAPKVGFERRLLETCQWHVSTAVVARRPTTSKIFNGCLPQQMESHRPDLGARSIRRDGRLLAECRWHSATAVGARRPTTSKIFNGCLRRKGIPPPRSQRPFHTEGWAALSRVHEVLA